MPIKPQRIEVSKDHLLAKGILRSWKIHFSEVRLIKVGRVPSLVDEIGVTLIAKEEFFFTDANCWFEAVAEALKLAELLGDEWYSRVEGGEVFEHKGPIPT